MPEKTYRSKLICIYFGSIQKSSVGPAKYFQRLWENRAELENIFQLEVFDKNGKYNPVNNSQKPRPFSIIRSVTKNYLDKTSNSAISALISFYLYYYRNAKACFKLILSNVNDVDIIYARDIFSMYFIARSLKFKSAKKILTLANNGDASKMLYERLPGLKYFSKILDNKIQQLLFDLDSIIVLSNDAKRIFKHTYPIHLHEKVRVLYNGIPMTEIKKNSIDPNLTDLFKFISVGTISKRKGHDLIVKAVYSLVKKGYKRFKIILIGDGTYTKEINKEIEKLKLENFFEVKGHLSSVEKYLAQAHCYIQASRDEGMPISLLEAMSAGLPAIVSNIAAMPEMVKDKSSGYIFESGNYTNLAEKLELMLTNENLKEMGAANMKIFKQKFTFERHLEGFIDILKVN